MEYAPRPVVMVKESFCTEHAFPVEKTKKKRGREWPIKIIHIVIGDRDSNS